MNALASANWKMILAVRADLQVFVEFLIEDHRAAFRTFGPEALGNFPLFGFGTEFGFFRKSRIVRSRRGSDRGLSCFEGERLLGKRGRAHHDRAIISSPRGQLPRRNLRQPQPFEALWRKHLW